MIRILVVDDNYSYVKLLRIFLATTEIDAHITTSAEDALDAIKERSFDLVLTDMKMPDIDGIELSIRIKENDKDMPILMMTSYLTADAVTKAKNAGISVIFDKCASLHEIVNNIMGHARNRHLSEMVFNRTGQKHIPQTPYI